MSEDLPTNGPSDQEEPGSTANTGPGWLRKAVATGALATVALSGASALTNPGGNPGTSPGTKATASATLQTGPETGVALGLENDDNGTLNTGQEGPSGGGLKELIPNVVPNIVAGSVTPASQGNPVGDGWHFEKVPRVSNRPAPKPIELKIPTSTPRAERITDPYKYPIKTPWEQDYTVSPELQREVSGAVQSCFNNVHAREKQGYQLDGVEIGGIASGEDNTTEPGDLLANLDRPSQLNLELANQRGLVGLQSAKELAPDSNIDPEIISFLKGKETDPNPEELKQIIEYAQMLGEDPLTVVQDYNRSREEGLQPLMDQLFEGNRGIVCIAKMSKLETSNLPGPDKTVTLMVPVMKNGEERTWRIEIPGEILLLPLLFIGLRSLTAAGSRRPKTPESPSPTPKLTPTQEPYWGPRDYQSYLSPETPKTHNSVKIKIDPPIRAPGIVADGTPPPIKKVRDPKPATNHPGQEIPQQIATRIKQPRPHNYHGGSTQKGNKQGRDRSGARRNKRKGTR